MRQHPDAVMIFAAGFGTRMGALTRDRPKPLVALGGRTLLDRALDLAAPLAPARTVVNTHYLGAQIADHLAGRDIAISHEAPDILDTGGGLRQALPLLGDGPVFTVNPDVLWLGENPLHLAQRHWDNARMDALLVTVSPEHAYGYSGAGDFHADADGRLTRGPGQIYGGVQILRTEALADYPERVFSLNLVWSRMAQAGRLFGVSYPGRWCDVGHPAGLEQAQSLLAGAQDV